MVWRPACSIPPSPRLPPWLSPPRSRGSATGVARLLLRSPTYVLLRSPCEIPARPAICQARKCPWGAAGPFPRASRRLGIAPWPPSIHLYSGRPRLLDAFRGSCGTAVAGPWGCASASFGNSFCSLLDPPCFFLPAASRCPLERGSLRGGRGLLPLRCFLFGAGAPLLCLGLAAVFLPLVRCLPPLLPAPRLISGS